MFLLFVNFEHVNARWEEMDAYSQLETVKC